MAISEFSAALNQVATERGIPVASVLESVKSALATAYKKDRKENGEEVEIEAVDVDLDPDTGEVRILRDGKDVTPAGFGRIAAQTAKQVILQKIRETEKEVVFDEFKSKIGTIVTGQVFRVDNGLVTLDLGKVHANGIMPQSEQVPTENYRISQRLKVLVKDVRDNPKGTEIIVSRSDPDFVKKLFEQEVPEIASGTVMIEAIAREAGSRTKMAVSSRDEKIDPVGSCVGQKGVRVQSIIAELFGEKIDIIPHSSTIEKFIAAALSPAKVTEVELDRENTRAIVSVPEDQQSLAIGKEGQNARLANKLTRWKIDIKGAVGFFSDAAASAQVDEKKHVVGVWDEAIRATEEKMTKPTEESEEKVEPETAEEAETDETEEQVSSES
ncbi:transcription termination factor NusA [candidate division WWE3 bacterium RIFOXYC1_FULL_39_7]|uniref:Transcription termination/antitermination protein NusA n=2 Tax=Katanobacteria TaxID=422282 RepID=A0A1F4X732_UNCKA|nr:MAG: transcription termination factor NusA [candidate division WWE3 bacterium RIFOXYC1_FULL_39_7]OGC77468.1 MAG: transcription termination factor NusA [candidate division WWE3 bacterium RIFOXYD1_FULL_39_9]